MTQLLSGLSLDAKRAMVAALVAERARRSTTYPLSSAQRRLWLIDRQSHAEPIYNVSRAFTLDGALDVSVLERSITEIVRRHASLRTTFALIDGQPVGIIGEPRPFVVERQSLIDVADDVCDVRVAQIVAEEARYRFALDRDLLIRGRLVTVAHDRHVLSLTVHHIAIDEWSLEIFFTELQTCYRAFQSGVMPELPPLEMQYADYARREQQFEQSAAMCEHLDFWKQRLAGAPKVIALPYQDSQSQQVSCAGAVDAMTIRPAVLAEFTALGRLTGATPFMLYLAAFAVLLHTVSGARDFMIGSPISGRSGVDAENLIGFFANALALRFEFAGDPSFAQCVVRTKEITLEAFEHREAPFDRVVNVVTNERIPGANPIFDVAFAMQHAPESQLRLPGLAVCAFEQTHDTSKFDLMALVRERPGGWEFALHYNTGRFAPATIATMLERLSDLLERVGAHPDRPLSSLVHGWERINATGDGFTRATAAKPVLPPPVPLAPPAVAAHDPMVEVLRARLRVMLEQILDTRPIADEADFFALGGHSLLAVRLIAMIEDEFDIRLPSVDFFARPTLAGLVEAVLMQSQQAAATPLMVLRRGIGTPLVVFHGDYSGGGFYLRTIVCELGDRTIYALPPHGVDGAAIPTSIEEMATERLAVLRRANVRPPFDLIGYCNGAAVALEVARRLVEAGEPPPRVFAIGFEVFEQSIVRVTTAVGLLGKLAALDERVQAKISLRLLRWKRRIRASGVTEIGAIFAEEMHWRRIASARRLAVTGSPATPVASSATPSLLDVYSDRLIRYRPGPYHGRITVLRPAVGEHGESRDESIGGWARVNPATDIELVIGDHQSAITTHALSLAHRLRARLDR